MPSLLVCHAVDSVAVALRDLAAGESVTLEGAALVVTQAIPAGHKVARNPLRTGDQVRKYGAVIGRATRDIAAGEHVHSHNLATSLVGEVEYDEAGTGAIARDAAQLGQWLGYVREDGRCATRNEAWVIPTVGCVAPLAEAVAAEANRRHAGTIDGVFAFAHPHGCSQLGDDLAHTRALLAGLCDNPNAGGVLLLGLGCESNQLDTLLDAVAPRSRHKVRVLRAQDAGDEAAEAAILLDELVAGCAAAVRRPVAAAELCVGLKCGGSDAFSGLTANPLLGRLSDRLAASGGRVVLTEIPEIFGAESDLFARATSREVRDRAASLLNRFKRYFINQGQPVSENPSPGNLAGGITTLEEKSLGAVQKAGRAPLVDVVDYGGSAHLPGVTLLEAPGNDAVSSTALAAAGATVILFTTGRGTPLGFPVPTVKVSSNTALASRKPGWIDFDAGPLLQGSPGEMTDSFAEHVLAVASGRPTRAERSGQRAIAIWKTGVTL